MLLVAWFWLSVLAPDRIPLFSTSFSAALFTCMALIVSRRRRPDEITLGSSTTAGLLAGVSMIAYGWGYGDARDGGATPAEAAFTPALFSFVICTAIWFWMRWREPVREPHKPS